MNGYPQGCTQADHDAAFDVPSEDIICEYCDEEIEDGEFHMHMGSMVCQPCLHKEMGFENDEF